jgi:hypothetical protein
MNGRGRREDLMRDIALALLAASGLAMAGSAPAEAVGTRYPYCIQGQTYPGLSNCTFTSYEQCQATASGRTLYCIEKSLLQRRRTRSAGLSRPQPDAFGLSLLLISAAVAEFRVRRRLFNA